MAAAIVVPWLPRTGSAQRYLNSGVKLRRAGLVDADGVPLVTPHGLRHTAASLMLAAGVPLIVVSRQLGHANPNVTAQVYAHLLCDSQLDEAAAAFAGLGSS